MAIVLILCFVSACKTDKKEQENTKTEDVIPKKNVRIPAFDKDLAYSYVEKQVNFGHRVPGTPPHSECRKWMVETLKSYGAEVMEQKFNATIFNGTNYEGTNVIASFNPSHKRRVLLAAHWDSRFTADQDPDANNHAKSIDGADDGGSGTGVLLAIASIIQDNPIDLGIDIILFDGEDQGEDGGGSPLTWCHGSQHWSKNLHKAGYNARFGILLDMVGAKDASFYKELYSLKYAALYTNKIWALAGKMGKGKYFINQRGTGVTDDHLFINEIAGIPTVNIIHTKAQGGFGAHWHTVGDNMSNIDKQVLGAVGQVVLAVIYNESGGRF